jgi:Tfp pilus assembly protein PilO
MSRLNRRLLIPVGAGVAVVLVWFLFLWGPQGSALSKARQRASQATAQRETLRDQLTRLQQSRRDQPLKQAQLETLRVAIPDDPNLAQFILDANDAASRSGIDFLSITPTPPSASAPAPAPTPTTVAGGSGSSGGGTTPTTTAAATTPAASAGPPAIKISMNISGGYFQVLDFVNRLNRLPRIVVIDGLSMGASATSAQLQVSLTARMFTTSSRGVAGASGAGGAGTPGAGTTTTTTAGGAATTTTARSGP